MTKKLISLVVLAACGGDDGGSTNDPEVITTVVLNFAPTTGAPVVATFNDPDGDGGAAPTIDPINLAPGNYTLTVGFENRLVTPAEVITDEVRDEHDFHLILYMGNAPLAQSYADMDGNGLPVGLTNNIVATAGTGQFTVVLRHMPPEEPPMKSACTVMQAKTGGLDSIGGSTDANVTFNVTVQ